LQGGERYYIRIAVHTIVGQGAWTIPILSDPVDGIVYAVAGDGDVVGDAGPPENVTLHFSRIDRTVMNEHQSVISANPAMNNVPTFLALWDIPISTGGGGQTLPIANYTIHISTDDGFLHIFRTENRYMEFALYPSQRQDIYIEPALVNGTKYYISIKAANEAQELEGDRGSTWANVSFFACLNNVIDGVCVDCMTNMSLPQPISGLSDWNILQQDNFDDCICIESYYPNSNGVGCSPCGVGSSTSFGSAQPCKCIGGYFDVKTV
jgi:hypothetical protein